MLTNRARASRVTDVSEGGDLQRKGSSWLSRPLTASALGTLSLSLSLWRFFLWTSFTDDDDDDATSLDPVCPWHLWILTALLADSSLKPETWHTLLSWQCCSNVITASWHKCLVSRIPWRPFFLASLAFGISFSWDLLLLTFSSLEITFSWHGFLLTPFFLYPFVSHFFLWDVFLWFSLRPSVLTPALAPFSPGIPFLLTFPVLFCTTKACTKTSQHYCLLQLAQRLPSTTLYYKACTKYLPKLLSATKLPQALSSTTSRYYFPCPLCTPQLGQVYIYISQYYFALQDLHKRLPSSTCLSRFLAHRSFLHTETVAHRSFYRQKLLTHRNFQTEKSLHMHSLLRDVFTQRSLYTQKPLYTHGSFQHTGVCNTQKCLHAETLNTQKLLHRKVFTNRSFYTQKFLHTHTHAFTHKSFDTQKKYMQKHLHTDAFTHRSFHTDRQSSTQRSFYTEITAPERDLGAKANLEACLKRIF